MNTRLVLTTVILIAATVPSGAQVEKPEIAPLIERVEVSVTTVDAYVTDRSGQPVGGLTSEDFEVFEDGKRQQITGFYVIENGQTRSSAPTGEDQRVEVKADQFRRKVVLMIDNNSIGKIPRDSAIETVQKFIENQFEEDYEWSVINVGAKAETVQPFTNQKSEVDAALLRVRQSPTFELQREMDRKILSDPVRAKLRETEFASGYSFEESVRFQGREQTMRHLRATINAARAVIQTCRAYSAAGGKKLLLLVSGGMEMNTSFSAYDSSTDRHLREMKREMELVLDTMVREANAANFSIYVVNPSSLAQRAPQHDVEHRAASGTVSVSARLSEGGSSQPADISDRDSAALTLTSGTGGRYLPANDVGQSMRVIGDETGNFYSLAYSPSHKNDGKFHRIDVRVKKPGMNVRHREGYVDLSPEQRLEQSLRSPITFAKEKGTLPVNLELGPTQPVDKGKLVLPLTARLPMRSLTLFQRERRQLGRVHIYLAVYDQAGTNVGFNHLVQDITIPEEQLQQVLGQEFRYTMRVGLKRGDYTLVVTLRDDLSNEIGTAFREVHL